MATKSKTPKVIVDARKIAAPFWSHVEAAGLDRYFLDRLLRALLRRWREDRYARVRQGGLHGEARAELARVFIDLDATSGGRQAVRTRGPGTGSERIVASWMRPRPDGAPPRRRRSRAASEDWRSIPLEVVLGGPGQGKSTVGRFLVLIHGAILLLTSPLEGIITPAERAQLEGLLTNLSSEEIPLPAVVRLPVWIELRELTDALLHDDEGERDPLGATLRWLATNELREPLDAAAIETALTVLPWVIVFDGLDEVPPERGRALVRGCVEEVRSRFAKADGGVIATSRPQSYDREVFGADLVERTLLPLQPDRAAVYTERFAACLYPDEESQRAQLLKGMHKALANPATAALMSNPLLVTIMAAIVVQQGDPSDRRWTLFEQYYTTLYKRETQRGTYASATLQDHAPLIDAIHRHVGMSLQARSEEASGVSALMPEHELRAIIHTYLRVDFPDDEAARLTEEVLRAAEQRLVLLVQSQEGLYGFELRSFQEFMAAWQIVSLKEAHTSALLQRLAPLDAWRNVVLFAIGHQYETNSPQKRERSVGLCASLDRSDDPAMRIALPGARLAIEVLADAPYGKAVKPREDLFAIALKLLRVPPDGDYDEYRPVQLWEIAPDRVLAELDSDLFDSARTSTAWATMLALPDDERLEALMLRHWPTKHEERRAIVRAYIQWFRRNSVFEEVGRWIARMVNEDVTIVMPADLVIFIERYGFSGNESGVKLTFSNEPKAGAAGKRLGCVWRLGISSQAPGDTSNRLGKLSHSHGSDVLIAAETFDKKWTASRLANALDDLAGSWDERSNWGWYDSVPWPLLTCLMAAQDRGALRSIAGRLRQGDLGDGVTWAKNQRKFGTVKLTDLKKLADSPDPLHAILVEGVMPPFDSARGSRVMRWSDGLVAREVLHDLDMVRGGATSPWVQRMIAQLMIVIIDRWLGLGKTPITSSWPSEDEFVQLIETAGTQINVAWLTILSRPESMAAVLMRTTTPIVAYRFGGARFSTLQQLVRPFSEALQVVPDSMRLQRALVAVLHFEEERRRAPRVSINPVGDGIDAWLLRFVSGHATQQDVPTLARLLAATDDGEKLRSSLQLLDAHAHSSNLAVPVVEALIARPDLSTSLRAIAVQFVADRLARATTGLASPVRWLAAGLPAPPPMPVLTEQPDMPGAHIASVEITNLRAFSPRFEVTAPPTSEPGQWMLFLGENATGKTTILRAIAMALASPADASAVPSNLDAPLRRDPSREGVVVVRTTDSRELTTTVAGSPSEERVIVAQGQMRPWVVGYGCRRGSALSGTDMDNAFLPFRDLDNLFDRPRGVIRASGWLKELQRLASTNGKRSNSVFNAAKAALCKVLLGAEDIRVGTEVHVDFKDGRQVPLALLSDGYLTTAGWVVDLMARWLKRNEARKDITNDFCATMEGVVLLDEIDLHLHPRWQERVIEDVRTLFPRMTFIATTHHPLTLRGARKGEVFVLADHDQSGTVTAVQQDIPPGTRVDELLTGAWFNRPSAVIDAETRKMLDDHRKLILEGAKAGNPERKALEATLRERLGRFADTSIERLAATIVAPLLAEDLPEPSAAKREEVRMRVQALLKRRAAKHE